MHSITRLLRWISRSAKAIRIYPITSRPEAAEVVRLDPKLQGLATPVLIGVSLGSFGRGGSIVTSAKEASGSCSGKIWRWPFSKAAGPAPISEEECCRPKSR